MLSFDFTSLYSTSISKFTPEFRIPKTHPKHVLYHLYSSRSRTTLAEIPLSDPGDILPASLYSSDNAIVPDYNVPFISVQPRALPGANIFAYGIRACCIFDYR